MAGTLLGLSAPWTPLPALVYVFPAILLQAATGGSLRRAFVVGWAAGATTNLVALSWVEGLLEVFGGFPWFAAVPVASLLFVAQGLVLGLATLLTEGLGRCGAPRWLAFPAAVVLCFSLAPALFPWRPSSATIGWLPWAQIAEVGGPPLLDGLAVLVGAGLWEAARTGYRLPAVVALVALFGPAIYGAVRIEDVEAERANSPLLHVGVVQPSVGIHDKHDPRQYATHLAILQDMTRSLEELGADVVVWPESAYPYPFPRGLARDLNGRRAIRQRGVTGPVIVGAVTQASRCDRWNSALAIDHEGFIRGVADKVELLAFGETVPLWNWLPPLQAMFPCPGLQAAAEPRIVNLEDVRYGILNCYEDVLPAHARTLALQEPELLINITNDAWFGDTREPYLHQLVARMRAIETRRDLVRAVNTGVSAHIDATGRTVYATDTWAPELFVAQARRLGGLTPWVRVGDVTTEAAYAFLLAWLAFGARAARRRRILSGCPSSSR